MYDVHGFVSLVTHATLCIECHSQKHFTNSICGRQRLTCRISLCWESYRMQSASLLALIMQHCVLFLWHIKCICGHKPHKVTYVDTLCAFPMTYKVMRASFGSCVLFLWHIKCISFGSHHPHRKSTQCVHICNFVWFMSTYVDIEYSWVFVNHTHTHTHPHAKLCAHLCPHM